MGYGTFLGNTGTSRERENPYPRWLMVCNELSCPQSHIHQCVITQTPQTQTNTYKLTHIQACACSVNTQMYTNKNTYKQCTITNIKLYLATVEDINVHLTPATGGGGSQVRLFRAGAPLCFFIIIYDHSRLPR